MSSWLEWRTDSIEQRLLTHLERQEAALVALGVLDVRHDQTELLASFATAHPASPAAANAQALRRLVESHAVLLLADRTSSQGSVRSHTAEIVRLLRLSRQRFAWHEKSPESPPLVRDLVWSVRSRFRPQRDQSLQGLLPPLNTTRPSDARLMEASEILLGAVADYARSWGTYRASAFQVRAHKLLLNALLHRGGKRGFVISAGTGAGKTHAFLFPTIVAAIQRRLAGVSGTIAICVYNRVRLASNQLQELLTLLRCVNQHMTARGHAALTVGIDFHQVPYDNAELFERPNKNKAPRIQTTRKWSYHEQHQAWECPWAACPHPGCQQPLLALPKSAAKKKESARLACAEHGEVSYLIPTRNECAAQPPTFYITSGESLHRRLYDSRYRRIFDGGEKRNQPLLMFDEIHLYESVEGIQAALLARRLRRRIAASGGQPVVVGLSATIAEPVQFMADFSGLLRTQIEVIEPRESELVNDGIEHFLTISTEPDEEISPLSTMIQASMILGHLLPQPDAEIRTLFGFTDSLDRVGRWSQRLHDADKEQQMFRLRQPGIEVADLLAIRRKFDRRECANPRDFASAGARRDCASCLRTEQPDPGCPVFSEGECWFAMQTVGRAAALRLAVQTSRRQADLSTADFVVASSSLEVGYDDPRVRAVVQYQAPSSPASFTQRKGRAGRPSHSRCYVLTVLSPFRRPDEFYFRNLQLLTDPVFAKIPLNHQNRTLLRAHILYLIFDRLAAKEAISAEQLTAEDLESLLRAVEPQRFTQLIEEIAETFQVDQAEILELVDDRDRGVLRIHYPQLVEKVAALASGQRIGHSVRDLLPKVLPPTLLAPGALDSLDLEEDDEKESVEILFGLSEGAPGNVRFRSGDPRWVPVLTTAGIDFEIGSPYGVSASPNHPPEASIGIAQLPPMIVKDYRLDKIESLPIFRPTRVRYARFPHAQTGPYGYFLMPDGTVARDRSGGTRIRDTSNSYLCKLNLCELPNGASEEWRRDTHPEIFTHPLSREFLSIELARCAADKAMHAVRFTVGTEYSLALEKKENREGILAFRRDGIPVGLGHKLEVDGLRLRWRGIGDFQPDDSLARELAHQAFVYFAADRLLTGNRFARAKLLEAISYRLASEVRAAREPAVWMAAFARGEGAVLQQLESDFALLFDPRERTMDAFRELSLHDASRQLIADIWRVTVAAWQTGSNELAAFVKDSLTISLQAALRAGIEHALGLELSETVDIRSDLTRDGHPLHDAIRIDLFETRAGGIGIIDLIGRQWQQSPLLLWDALEEATVSCPTARREMMFSLILDQDDTFLDELAAAAAPLLQAATAARSTSAQLAAVSQVFARRFGAAFVLENIDLRNTLHVLAQGQIGNPRQELALLQQIEKEAASFRAQIGRWPTSREIGVLLLDQTRPDSHGSPVQQLAARIASWIDRTTDDERFRRVMHSQLQRRYLHQCVPACPACLGTALAPRDVPPHRRLLGAYLAAIQQQRGATVEFDDGNLARWQQRLATLWDQGIESLRVRYYDRSAQPLAELIAALTVLRVPIRYTELPMTVGWSRTLPPTQMKPDEGYGRELSMQLGGRL